MKITSIEPQRNKNRVNIYVDDVFLHRNSRRIKIQT